MSKIYETELVIHSGYGGFGFDMEMALWLMEKRGWEIVRKDDYDYKKKYPLEMLTEILSHDFYSPHHDDLALRTHKDVIDCVRELKKLHENDNDYRDRYKLIHKLRVVKLCVDAEIEDYNDGYERVNCHADCEED